MAVMARWSFLAPAGRHDLAGSRWRSVLVVDACSGSRRGSFRMRRERKAAQRLETGAGRVIVGIESVALAAVGAGAGKRRCLEPAAMLQIDEMGQRVTPGALVVGPVSFIAGRRREHGGGADRLGGRPIARARIFDRHVAAEAVVEAALVRVPAVIPADVLQVNGLRQQPVGVAMPRQYAEQFGPFDLMTGHDAAGGLDAGAIAGTMLPVRSPVRIVVLPDETADAGCDPARQGVGNPVSPVEIGLVPGRFIGGDERLAEVHVGVLTPVAGDLGEILAGGVEGEVLAAEEVALGDIGGVLEQGFRTGNARPMRHRAGEHDESVAIGLFAAVDRLVTPENPEITTMGGIAMRVPEEVDGLRCRVAAPVAACASEDAEGKEHGEAGARDQVLLLPVEHGAIGIEQVEIAAGRAVDGSRVPEVQNRRELRLEPRRVAEALLPIHSGHRSSSPPGRRPLLAAGKGPLDGIRPAPTCRETSPSTYQTS